MQIAGFIEANKERVIERWKTRVVERLALRLPNSKLINDLPEFIDGLVYALRNPDEQWIALNNVRDHAHQRLHEGVDIKALAEEIAVVGEAILELLNEDGQELLLSEMCALTRVIGQGTAVSASTYVTMRDKQLTRQAAQHFSFIAHELRNPLQNARMAATLLTMNYPEFRQNQQQRFKPLERLERSLSQLSELVDQSLVEARLYGEPEIKIESCNARELAGIAYDDVIDHADARGVSVLFEIESFEFDADRKLMLSALTNLLKNAVKFTRADSCIKMRGRCAESRVLFEIEDQCGGMPEALPQKLFQPFVQASEDKSGFGLGLMIVKQAVEAHFGSARVANYPGKGCIFILDLPQQQPKEKRDIPLHLHPEEIQ